MDSSLQAVSEAIIHQPWLSAATASVVLQFIALVRLRGILRSLSLILAVVTGSVGALVVTAYVLDPGNLWQLLLHLATPPVFVSTAGLLVMGLLVGPTTPGLGEPRENHHGFASSVRG
jgi:hypothetical protein